MINKLNINSDNINDRIKYSTTIKKFNSYNEELNSIDLFGNNGINEGLSRSEKIEAIIEFTSKDENSADADRGDLINLSDEMLDKFYNNLFGEQTNEGVTVSSPGSGTAVGGGSEGSFVSSMGVSMYGGDSGSAFATNSSVSGMGPIVSSQPSSIPGDVRGSTKGSGDIGSRGGVYTKQTTGKRNKKKKSSRSKIASDIDKLYTTNYRETSDNGKIIQSWSKFNEGIFDFFKKDKKSIREERKDQREERKNNILSKVPNWNSMYPLDKKNATKRELMIDTILEWENGNDYDVDEIDFALMSDESIERRYNTLVKFAGMPDTLGFSKK